MTCEAPFCKCVGKVCDAYPPAPTAIPCGHFVAGGHQTYDPDCGACVEACPVDACFAEDQLPEEWQRYSQVNAEYYTSAK